MIMSMISKLKLPTIYRKLIKKIKKKKKKKKTDEDAVFAI